MDESFPIDQRNRLRRRSQRGRYDHATVNAIFDEARICHVAFQVDGQPIALPTIHARIGSRLYMHGSMANRMLGALVSGGPVSATATLVDGLVLARSAFHHSMNYRSAVAFGRARNVDDPAEKLLAFEALVERLMPGRWNDSRPPNVEEIATTRVVCMPIDQASAKVRTGDPVDDASDHTLDHWAGVVPLTTVPGSPVPAEDLRPGIVPPPYLP
ncbi:MAG: pyridoxamine 5'-phosphate oxidase family protein [Myxococcota bacterium]